MKRTGWLGILAAGCISALLYGCGGGGTDAEVTSAAAEAVGGAGEEQRAHALAVTAASTTTTLAVSTDSFTARSTAAVGNPGTFTATTTSVNTIASSTLALEPGEFGRPGIAISDSTCASGTKTPTKWTCKAVLTTPDVAGVDRPWLVSVNAKATTNVAGDTTSVSTPVTLLPAGGISRTGVSLFAGKQEVYWGLIERTGLSQRLTSIYTSAGTGTHFYTSDAPGSTMQGFMAGPSYSLNAGWLKGVGLKEYDFITPAIRDVRENSWTIANPYVAGAFDLKGKVETTVGITRKSSVTVAPTLDTPPFLMANISGTYLGYFSQLQPGQLVQDKVRAGYTISPTGELVGVSAPNISIDASGNLVYLPNDVKCTFNGQVVPSASKLYATVQLNVVGLNCALYSRPATGVVAYNYSNHLQMVGVADSSRLYAGMLQSVKVK